MQSIQIKKYLQTDWNIDFSSRLSVLSLIRCNEAKRLIWFDNYISQWSHWLERIPVFTKPITSLVCPQEAKCFTEPVFTAPLSSGSQWLHRAYVFTEPVFTAALSSGNRVLHRACLHRACLHSDSVLRKQSASQSLSSQSLSSQRLCPQVARCFTEPVFTEPVFTEPVFTAPLSAGSRWLHRVYVFTEPVSSGSRLLHSACCLRKPNTSKSLLESYRLLTTQTVLSSV